MVTNWNNIYCGNEIEIDFVIRNRIADFKDNPIHWEGFFHIDNPNGGLGLNIADVNAWLGGRYAIRQTVPLDGNQTFNPVYDTQQLTGLGIVRLEGFISQDNRVWLVIGYNSQSRFTWINLELIPR